MAAITHAANANAVVTTGWGSPTNGYADDAAYATATPAKNTTVNSDFGFADFTSGEIPDGSTIGSVTVSMKVKNATTVTIKTHGVQGRDNGATSGTEATATGNTTEATITATLSGVTLADVRSASTLLKARVRSTQGASSTTSLSSLNYVSMTVNYTLDTACVPTAAAMTTSMGTPTVAVSANVTVVPGPAGGADYAATILADSPVAWYRFAEASGNYLDEIAGGSSGVATGTVTRIDAGPTGKAVDFGGAATDGIDVPDQARLDLGDGPFSIECFVRRDAAAAGTMYCPMSKGTAAYGLSFLPSTQTPPHGFALNKPGTNPLFSSETTSDTGVWHHFVITRSAVGTGNTKVYKDGVEGTTELLPTQVLSNTATALNIGREAGWKGFSGALAEVSLFNAVLTSTQVSAHYTAGTGAGAGGLVLTAFVPTVTVGASSNVTVTPPAASLALAAFAPTVTATNHRLVTPGVASLVTATFAPNVTLGFRVVPATAGLTLSTFAPTVTASDRKLVTIGVAALTTALFAPTVTASAHKTATPPAAALTLATFAPTVTANAGVTVAPPAASLTLSGLAPTVTTTTHVTATPPAASLSLTTFVPTVATTAHQTVTPAPASLTLNGYAPTVTAAAGLTIVPAAASLALTGFAPLVTTTAHQTVTPTAASLALSAFAPTITASDHKVATPPPVSLVLTGLAPTVATTANVTAIPTTASLAMTAFAPDMVLTDNWTFAPGAAALTLAMFAPLVVATAAALAGRTLDQHGDPIGSCTVDAFTSATNTFYGTATSDSAGRYSIAVLPGVPYFLVAYKGDEVFGASARDLTA